MNELRLNTLTSLHDISEFIGNECNEREKFITFSSILSWLESSESGSEVSYRNITKITEQ